MSLLRVVVMTCALSVGTTALAQQNGVTVPARPHLVATISRLELPAPVRVSYLANWAEGTLLKVGRDSMTMQVGTTVQPLALYLLDSLSIRRRSTVRGAIGGAFLGGGLAMLAGIAYDGKRVRFTQRCDCNTFPIHAALIGVGGGAPLGAALGHRRFRWHRVYL